MLSERRSGRRFPTRHSVQLESVFRKESTDVSEFKGQGNPQRGSLPQLPGPVFRNANEHGGPTYKSDQGRGSSHEKKELIYNLGAVLDAMGKKDEAAEQFKLIYEVDIGYKDVQERVDAYYAGQS